MERETNDEEKKLILITSFSPFVIYEWKKVETERRTAEGFSRPVGEREAIFSRASSFT